MLKELQSTQLFQGIPQPHLEEITTFSELIAFNDGQILLGEGDRGDYDLYLLISGSLDVVSHVRGKGRERDMILMSSRQEVVGEIAWVLKTPRTAQIRAKGSTRVIRIRGDRLEAFFLEHPETGYVVARRLLEVVATKLTNTNSLFKMIMKNSFGL